MSSLSRTSSWVIVHRDTGAALFETFSEDVARAVNTEKYAALPILAYLQGVNRRIVAQTYLESVEIKPAIDIIA